MTENLKNDIEKLKYIIQLYDNNASEVIWYTNTDFTIQYISNYVETLIGYKPEELINKNLKDILHSDSIKLLNDTYTFFKRKDFIHKQHLKNKYEFVFIKKNGNEFTVEIILNPVYAENKLAGVSGTFYDISERNYFQDALKTSYSIPYKIIDNIQAIIYITDIDTYDIIFTNAYTENIFGNIIGKKCWKVLRANQDGPCDLCPNKRLITANGTPKGIYQWEYFNNKNGRWYQAYDQAIKWVDNRIVRFEIAYDITDKKKDEKSLFKFLNLQKLFSETASILNSLDSFQDRIYKVLKKIGSYMDISRAFVFEFINEKNVFIKKYEWIKDKSLITDKCDIMPSKASLNIINKLKVRGSIKNQNAIFTKYIREFFKPYKTQSVMIVPITADNQIISFIGIDDAVSKRKWTELEVNQLKIIANLITNAYLRKNFEEEIKRSEKELKIANDTKDKFFSIIAHDLKNPFNTIIGFNELILRNYNIYDDKKRLQMLEYMRSSSKNVYSLLKNMLMWARTQTGSIKYNPEYIDINSLVEENVALIKPTAEKKQIKVTTSIFFEGLVYADIFMVSTIIRNLLINAIKFTPKNGKIKIDTNNVNGFAEITITDSGIGIEKNKIEQLFSINQTFSEKGTDGETGSGLGLVICKEFVEKNKGKIFVESELNKGATFKFTIPDSE